MGTRQERRSGQPCSGTTRVPPISSGVENCPPAVMLNSPPFLLRRPGSGTWPGWMGPGDMGRDLWRAEGSWATPASGLCWAPGGLGGWRAWTSVPTPRHLRAAGAGGLA